MAKTAKRIDLSKDKTSPYVKSVIRKIDRSLAEQVKVINVPAFRALDKSIHAESYFMNYKDFAAILGDNVKLLDRMMMHSICEFLTEDIVDAMSKSKGQVGVWDKYSVYNVLAAATTFMLNSDTNEKYLTGLQYVSLNSEELAKFPENSYMAFSDYNPNRFVQMCLTIRNVALEAIGGIMEKGIPNIFVHKIGGNTQLKMFELKRAFMQNDMNAALNVYKNQGIEDLSTTPATESLVRVFTDNFEKPFMAMLYSHLLNGGFSENVVNLTMGTVRLHILFDDPVGKMLSDINITVRLVSKIGNKNVGVEYVTTIGDEFDGATTDLEQISKTKQETYGKKIRKFYLDMCVFTANTYMQVIRTNNENSTDDASGDVTDISESDLDKLLEDGLDTDPVE